LDDAGCVDDRPDVPDLSGLDGDGNDRLRFDFFRCFVAAGTEPADRDGKRDRL
jgi:hypothetical protein